MASKGRVPWKQRQSDVIFVTWHRLCTNMIIVGVHPHSMGDFRVETAVKGLCRLVMIVWESKCLSPPCKVAWFNQRESWKHVGHLVSVHEAQSSNAVQASA